MREFSKKFSQKAIMSLLFEVSASPKPGLVDRYDNGSHDDMDIFTFISSSIVLQEYFEDCYKNGYDHESRNYIGLIKNIRKIGVKAEKTMFEATDGVNTQKGLIFSFGIILQALGLYMKDIKADFNEKFYIDISELCEIIKSTTKGITDELKNDCSNNKTYGELLFEKYGIKGIRGEVESGFSNVRIHGLPILIEFDKILSKNDAIVQCLINIMEFVEDTNVLGRHGISTLKYVQKKAEKINRLGAMKTKKGRDEIYKCNIDFITKNISVGGSADLTAISIFFHELQKLNVVKDNIY